MSVACAQRAFIEQSQALCAQATSRTYKHSKWGPSAHEPGLRTGTLLGYVMAALMAWPLVQRQPQPSAAATCMQLLS